jgi:hypothetical protein
MGSFNDLVIHPANGHPIDSRDVDAVNTSSRSGRLVAGLGPSA